MKRLLSLLMGMLVPMLALADVAPLDSRPVNYLSLAVVGAILLIVIVHIAICLIPFFMARNRGRSGLLWLIISFFIGWWWTIIILLIIGDSTEKKMRDMGIQ